PVRPVRVRTWEELARIETEPHRGAHLVDVPLLGHEVDDRCRGECRELGRVRVRGIELLAREVDHCALHTEAEPEIWDAVVARITRSLHLAFDAAVAESAGHDDAGDSHQR